MLINCVEVVKFWQEKTLLQLFPWDTACEEEEDYYFDLRYKGCELLYIFTGFRCSWNFILVASFKLVLQTRNWWCVIFSVLFCIKLITMKTLKQWKRMKFVTPGSCFQLWVGSGDIHLCWFLKLAFSTQKLYERIWRLPELNYLKLLADGVVWWLGTS